MSSKVRFSNIENLNRGCQKYQIYSSSLFIVSVKNEKIVFFLVNKTRDNVEMLWNLRGNFVNE